MIADQLERYEQKRSQFIADAEALLARPVETDDDKSIVSALRTELQRAQRAVSKATDGTAKERSVIAAAREAIVLLDRDDAVCPTCMRPIATDECDSARSAHKERERNARAEAESLRRREKPDRHTTQQSPSCSRASNRYNLPASTPRTSTSPIEPPPKPSSKKRAALWMSTTDNLAQRDRASNRSLQVASDDQIRQDERDLQQAYRREAVALAGAQALREAADRVIESRIEPIATEVRWRWKRLFANEGLTLRADGTIVRVQAGQELGWDTLSGGERTWARIVTHLLVIAATTSLSFAWFDEPLEHLDPQFRHAVAATPRHDHTGRHSPAAPGHHLRAHPRTNNWPTTPTTPRSSRYDKPATTTDPDQRDPSRTQYSEPHRADPRKRRRVSTDANPPPRRVAIRPRRRRGHTHWSPHPDDEAKFRYLGRRPAPCTGYRQIQRRGASDVHSGELGQLLEILARYLS